MNLQLEEVQQCSVWCHFAVSSGCIVRLKCCIYVPHVRSTCIPRQLRIRTWAHFGFLHSVSKGPESESVILQPSQTDLRLGKVERITMPNEHRLFWGTMPSPIVVHVIAFCQHYTRPPQARKAAREAMVLFTLDSDAQKPILPETP